MQSFSQQQATGGLTDLVQLLRIICSGNLQAYQQFEAKNKGIFATHGIDANKVEYSMRLLALCALGSQQQSLPYSLIASSLSVSEDEVEIWVVDAVSQGLLEAHMDQFTKTVTVA
jgi:PCI domain